MGQDFPFDIEYVTRLVGLRIRRPCSDGVYTDCPFCGDNRGKLKVNYHKNIWRCNYCGEKGGMLKLYAMVRNVSTAQANSEICDSIMNEGLCADGSLTSYGQPVKRQTLPPKECKQADPEVVHRTLTGLLGMLTLTKLHREHLQTVRGLTDEQIDRLGYKSVPAHYLCKSLTDRLISEGYTVEGVPGFYTKDGKWTVRFPSMFAGILIPVRGVDGKIRGCQIRLDVPMKDKNAPADKQGAKYVWLSSSGKPNGTPSGSPVHIAGDIHARAIYLTEGILKSDIAYFLMNRTFAGVAGINNTAQLDQLLSWLAENGTQEIVLAPDMDRYRNAHVSSSVTKIIMMVRKYGMECRLLYWNPNYKGIDDWQLSLKRRQPPKEPQEIPDEQRRQQSFRIYQLDISMGRVIPFAFGGMQLLQKAGYEQPPAAEYRLVHEGILPYAEGESVHIRLMRLVEKYKDDLPEGYHGRNLAPSDVIELYEEGQRKYYYRDEKAFWPVQFSPMLVKKQ